MARKRGSLSKTLSTRPRRTQAAEQYLGYALQPVRFLQLLIQSGSSGATVSLEVFEDVGVQTATDHRLASQTKSALVKNPISDRAVDLWKTLSNWLQAVETGALDPDTTIFELYLGRRHRGQIAESLDSASTATRARSAIDAARTTIWGAGPQYRRRKYVPERLAQYVNHVLNPDVADQLARIIERFQLTMASKDPISDLRRQVQDEWVRPESVDEIVRYAQGWVKEQVDALIMQRQPAIIHVEDFKRAILSFLPRCDFRNIIGTYAGVPDPKEVYAERNRTYVRQLDLIALEDEDLIQAINDYLRASVVRSKLAEQGIINDESFTEFAEGLIAYWRNKRRRVKVAYSALDPTLQGQMLLSDCCTHQPKLQGLEVPPFFTPGSYHALANKPAIGWHPDYESILGTDRA